MDSYEISSPETDLGLSEPASANEQQNDETPALGITPAEEPGKLWKGLCAAVNILLATVCGLTFVVAVFCLFFWMMSVKAVGTRDFTIYWTAAQQIAHHGNPYDGAALLRTARAAGLPDSRGIIYMRNPPWTLPLVYPLGFAGIMVASAAWTAMLLACLIGSVYMLWVMHGKPRNSRQLLGYTFGPALICLIMGQITILALLGLVLFLRLHRTHPFLAGLSLWFCMLKPHLFLPFGVVLLAWIVVSRSYKVVIGAAVAMAASCAIAFMIAPMEWIQYAQMMREPVRGFEFVVCLSALLRLLIWKNAAWFQYVPAVQGCVWGLWYFWPRRHTWDWMKDGSTLMLVSLITAPYSFLYDQVLAIPALLQGAFVTRSRNMLITLALLSAAIEAGLIETFWNPAAVYIWTLWSSPAWLAWYLFATRMKGTQAERIREQVA
jgi:hypothetical protein